MRRVFAILALALPAMAGEYAVLASGSRLYAERHETDGVTVRLFRDSGAIEIPVSAVAGFEIEDYAAPPPAPDRSADPVTPAELLDAAAVKNGLPPELVRSVAEVESAYSHDAVSRRGAVGIMQLMPETARQLQADPSDPEQNADAGARYLRHLLLRYRDDNLQLRKALAAYNAGPSAVDRYGSVPPYPETQNYVRRVIERFQRLGRATQPPR